MSWFHQDFLDALRDQQKRPRYVLESIQVGHSYSGGHYLGTPFQFSSFDEFGYDNVITEKTSSVRHAFLSPGTWERSHGSLTIGLLLDHQRNERHTEILKGFRRGQWVRLRLGLRDMTVGEFQPVFVGVLRNVRWSRRGGWQMEIVELIGGLSTRLTRTGNRTGLFSGLSTTTVATSNYTAGNATVVTADASGFEQATGHAHLIRVTPDTGNPFYLTATKAANTFTIVSRDIFDTTDADASIGALVEEIAYMATHPITGAARILTSTGLASNGSSDLLPERWGLGIPSDLVDTAHMSQQQALLFSKAQNWYMRVDAEQPDGLSWLSGHLRAGGLFLAMRQGQITVRPVLTTNYDFPIDNDDIIDLSYEQYDSDSPIEYSTFRVTYGSLVESSSFTGDSTKDLDETPVATRPAQGVYTWECPDVWRSDLTLATTADVQVQAFDADIRQTLLFRYLTRVPERMRIQLVGWATAEASLGDTLFIKTTIITSRMESPVFEFDEGKRGMIIGGGPDWFRGGCQWEVIFPADVAEV